MNKNTFGFIGFGLIGGSIAHSIKEYCCDSKIFAYDPNQEALELAYNEHIVNDFYNNLDDSALIELSQCEFVFLCAPVSDNDRNLMNLSKYLSESTIITDVGSVKTSIHKTMHDLNLSHCFIGGHPMAGSEKNGYKNSSALIIENAYYIITPSKDVPLESVERFQNLIASIKAIPITIDEQMHDYITAAISHLPHIIASSLVNLIEQKDFESGIMKTIAAGGFKDLTRIASSSPVMWESICMTNSDNIVKLLDSYIENLGNIKQIISTKESKQIYDFFENAKEYRDSFNAVASGPIKKEFTLFLDLKDEAGAIASTAALLASVNLSIKNIGIMHNREFQNGALRVEFYDESSKLIAKEQLTLHNYKIY